MKEQDYICNANPVNACMYVQQVECVVLYSAHMFNHNEGFVDSNLTLCDLQISGEERFVHWNVRQVFVSM